MKRIIAVMALLAVPSLALGWSKYLTHPSQTDLALQLIESEDSAGRYRRLYSRNWWTGPAPSEFYNPRIVHERVIPGEADHPAVMGAFAEGLWGHETLAGWALAFHSEPDAVINWVHATTAFGTVSKVREPNHYGAGALGAAWAWREEIASGLANPDDRYAGVDACVRGAGRFVAADPWAAGQCGNAMGFAGAVGVYRHGTVQAMREGVRRAGHAAHIVQDMGQPDHGRGQLNMRCSDLEDGDGRHVLASTLLSIAALARTTFAGEPSAPTPSTGELARAYPHVGLNGFVRVRWLDIVAALRDAPPIVLPTTSLAAVLADANDDAQAIAAGRPGDRPVGCADASRPGIALDAPNEDWLELAVDLNRAAIGHSAGLLMHFFDVVNPPPFAAEIAVAQDNAVGGAYAARWNDVLEPRHDLRWNEHAEHSSGPPLFYRSHTFVAHVPDVVARRTLEEPPTKPLVAGFDATVRVRFAPNEIVPKAMAEARVRLLDIELPLALASTDANGQWWQGTLPIACNASAGTRPLEVLGVDAEAHLATRADAGLPVGNALDGDPATVAFADDADPAFALANYETAAPRFWVDVDYLAYHGVRVVSRVFGPTGVVRDADRAVVYRGVGPHTAGVLNQAHRIDAVIETDHGDYAASLLRRCVGVSWHLGAVRRADTGTRVAPADGLRVELEDAGPHGFVRAAPSDHTPLGEYVAEVTATGDAFGLAPHTFVVRFEVTGLPAGFERLAGRFFDKMGFDPKGLAGLGVFLALRDALAAPPLDVADHFGKWTASWDAAKRVGAWLDYAKPLSEYDEFGVALVMRGMADALRDASEPAFEDVAGVPVDFETANPDDKSGVPPGWDG